MRYQPRHGAPAAEGDMTPMIDMTFQLIAFFMVLINFSEVDQNQRIRLPTSELAKPPEAPPEHPITLQVTKGKTIIFKGEEVTMDGLPSLLRREYKFLNDREAGSAKRATVIIRADREAKTGRVQEVIKICQDVRFEKFALRAKQRTVSVRQGN